MEPVVGMAAPTSTHTASREIPRTVQARVIGTTVVNNGGAAHVSLPQQHHVVGGCQAAVPQHHQHVVVSHNTNRAVPLVAPQSHTIVHPGHVVSTRAMPMPQASGAADLSHPGVTNFYGGGRGATPSSAELLRQGRLVGEKAISKEELMHKGILMEGPPERAPGPPMPADPAGAEARHAMFMQETPMEPIQASAGSATQHYQAEPQHMERQAHAQGYHDYAAHGEYVSEPIQQYDHGHDPFLGQQAAAAPTTQFYTGPAASVNPYETHVFDDHAAANHANPYHAEPYGDSGPAPSIQPHNLR